MQTPHGPEGSPPPTPALTFGKRLAIACALAILGAALLFDPRGQRLPEMSYALFGLSVVVVAFAIRARGAARKKDREFEELEARWPEIEAAVRTAEASGESPVRALQAIGITGYEARKWIQNKLHGDAPNLPPEGTAPKNTSPSASILEKYTEGNGPSPTRPWGML